ncbi:MAG TPA: hypothetical protein PLP05_12555, partial [Sedimentisphaerales bacterium]|nr:hypothetical protein [Sedimentisphaerales bacterium]
MVFKRLFVIFVYACCVLICFVAANGASYEVKRKIPLPLDGNPGNIYLDGQEVKVKVPADLSQDAVGWQIFDDSQKKVGEGKL